MTINQQPRPLGRVQENSTEVSVQNHKKLCFLGPKNIKCFCGNALAFFCILYEQ